MDIDLMFGTFIVLYVTSKMQYFSSIRLKKNENDNLIFDISKYTSMSGFLNMVLKN